MLIADFLKANYFARPKFLLGNFAQVKGHKKPKKLRKWPQKCENVVNYAIFGSKTQILRNTWNILCDCTVARSQLLETLAHRIKWVSQNIHRIKWVFKNTHGIKWVFQNTHRIKRVFQNTHRIKWVIQNNHRIKWVFQNTHRIKLVFQNTHNIKWVCQNTHRIKWVF